MILIPAYNLNAKLATKYEAQIAAVMHRQRNIELNRTADLPDDAPMRSTPRKRREAADPAKALNKPLTPTDEVLLKLLKGNKLTATEIMRAMLIGRDTLRTVLLRLASRGMVVKEVRGNHITWHTVGDQSGT